MSGAICRLALIAALLPGVAPPAHGQQTAALQLRPGGLVELDIRASDVQLRLSADDTMRVRVSGEVPRASWSLAAAAASVSLKASAALRDSRFEVLVPSGARVVVRLVAGDLSARGLRSELELSTQAGNVDVDSLAGSLDVTAVAGDISVRWIQGGVRANAIAGDVVVHDVTGDVRVDAVSGRITLSDVSSRTLAAHSVAGPVSCSGAVPIGAAWSLESFSGDVRLRVPSNTNATVRLESFSGRVRSEIPSRLEMSGARMGPGERAVLRLGRSASGTTMENEATVWLKSFSGAVVVQPLERRDEKPHDSR